MLKINMCVLALLVSLSAVKADVNDWMSAYPLFA